MPSSSAAPQSQALAASILREDRVDDAGRARIGSTLEQRCRDHCPDAPAALLRSCEGVVAVGNLG